MFQGTEANRSLQGIREALSVVVASIILNPICHFVEPGVLCLSEHWLHLFVGILGCFIGGRLAFLLMCSKNFALLVKHLSDFLIVLIKPVFMWACISAELRECSMVHRIYFESYQVFDCCSLCRRQCLSNFLTKSPLLVVFAWGRRLGRICMLSFGQSSSLRCTAYHFCWL